jgi:4-hydroxy-tetrahydrodipicolinate synthase
MEPETFAALAKLPRFVGDKEAAGSTDQASRIMELCGPDFVMFSGDDSMTLPFMSVGARGVISVVSNIVPAETVAMVRAFAEGRAAEAAAMHRRMFPLVKALFIETNPVPVKTAMGLLGRCSPELRLPMAPMEPANVEKLKVAMRSFGLKVQA